MPQPTAQSQKQVPRGPPILPPGMPVKASVAGVQTYSPQPQPYKHSPHPSPKSRPTSYVPKVPAQQQQHHHSSRATSRHPNSFSSIGSKSPALSYDSAHSYDLPQAQGGLRDSTRVNIRASAPPRQPSARLDWESESFKSPKEPALVTPKEDYTPQIQIRDQVDTQFENLLDSLQVSDAVRQKFHTVSQDVKSSILHSSMNSNPTILNSLGLPVQKEAPPPLRKRLSTPLLRKAKSSASLGSPGGSPHVQVGQTYSVGSDAFTIVASPLTPSSSAFGSPSPMNRASMDINMGRPRPQRPSAGPRPMSMNIFGHQSGSSGSMSSYGRTGARGLGIAMGEQPQAFIDWLGMYRGTSANMEVSRCKKLRMLLRHESTDWVAEFIELGGYKLILARLQDLLDVEWREEQHDDQMLYELLRCVKALSTSEVGKSALRAAFPKPFPALSALLFSEKKPGDLPSRQIIVELWLYLFDLFPPAVRPAGRPTSVRFNGPQVDICEAVRGLLLPDIPDPRKDHHEFITIAHQPRIFKAWVQELSDICRDYFWIMCHASNTLWAVDEVDEKLVEKPVAPGGATGGVEFEAMNYATIHFKLLNTLCKHLAVEDMRKATKLHYDLLSSGMDRILVTMRKASTTYYPGLHLELARYVALLRAASPNARLPHLIDKMVGPPPDALRKRDYGNAWLDTPSSVPVGGGRRGGWEF